MSLLKKFERELEDIKEITEEQVKEKLEYLVNAPLSYPEGFDLTDGIFRLMEKCKANKKDERFREAVYRKVIKILEAELGEEDINHQTDYASSLLSNFMHPEIPKEYALKIYPVFLRAIERFFKKRGYKQEIEVMMLQKLKTIIEDK